MKLYTASANMNDAAAIETLLAPIKNGEQLRKILKPGHTGRTQGYDKGTRTARYLMSDGTMVVCYTVADITLEQAATIAAECDSVTEWNTAVFQAVVERALGVEFGKIN